ncbi:LysM peptidoglycan-binding domain-containing protein [Photobacterium chitinilyticum]|uniref:LysM peptidoglycan-binding domain-containing protein n=1 Tax=Photobacterium chitinilyticum TaxID=2485123 RepID=UPI003D1251D1
MRLLVLFWALFWLFPIAWASPSKPLVKEGISSVYTVRKGDTLWDISAHFLSNPWLWPRLWEANSYIENPHLIYPGDQLHLVWFNGQPQLQLKKRVKVSPSIRIKRSPITTLQESLLLPYLVEHRLLTSAELDRLPRVLGDSNGKGYISPGDTVWVDTGLELGEWWWVYRPGKLFSRQLPKGGEGISVRGLEEIAKVKVTEIEGDISQVSLSSFRQEIRQNDVLLPASLPREKVSLRFVPSEPPLNIQAKILGHLDVRSYIATSDIVVLDRGHLDNVSAGNIFHLYRSGALVEGDKGEYQYQNSGYLKKQYQLSQMALGEIMVIRPYEHFSLAVVTRATEPLGLDILALPPRQPFSESTRL